MLVLLLVEAAMSSPVSLRTCLWQCPGCVSTRGVAGRKDVSIFNFERLSEILKSTSLS